MKNLKHSIVAMIAIAMISSLAAVQAVTINNNKQTIESKINSASAVESIKIAEVPTETDNAVAIAESVEETPVETDKSYFQLGYVMITSGTLDVKEMPSYESNTVGSLNVCDQVEILEFSESWFKIHSNGTIGYVPNSSITIERADAEYAAMHYDNYKMGKVSASSGVRLRSQPSTDCDIITEFDDGTDVVLLWSEGEFVRVAYGPDYDEGYIINYALELTGEWLPKATLSQVQTEAAQRREAERIEAERAEAERIAAAQRAAAAERAAQKKASSKSYNTSGGGAPAASNKGQAIVNTAMKYLGVPYVWGGTSPSGFDCSGLVQYACRANGVSIARVASAQRNCGTYVSRDNLQPGDLVFFDSGSGISHVGIYVGNGNMIHAPHTGDVVKISSINTSYRTSQYAGAVRVY